MKNKVISIFFILIILLGSTTVWFSPKKEFSKTENRRLQKAPAFSLKRLLDGDFIKEFETFTTDQFPARDRWVALKSYGDIAIGKKDNGKVYFGNKMLFSTDTVDEKQQRKNAELLEIIFNNIKQTSPDTEISMMVAPMSPDIYPENLPKYASLPDIIQVDKIFEPMAERCGVKYLKTYEEIKKAKKNKKLLYYRTDHHWTSEGARVAAEVFRTANGFYENNYSDYNISIASNKFYGTHQSKTNLKNIPMDVILRYDKKGMPYFKLKRIEPGAKEADEYESLYFDKFLKKKDKYSYFLGGNSARVDIFNGIGVTDESGTDGHEVNFGKPVIGENKGRTLLLIRDSFANCFIPFVAGDFDRIIAIDFRYFRGSLKQLVANEKITDVLVLYNMMQISSDRNLVYGTM